MVAVAVVGGVGGSSGAGGAKKDSLDYAAENAEIIGRLDIAAEFEQMGVRFVGRPRSSGAYECYAIDRPDQQKPSSFVNVNTGRYVDKGRNGANLSLWEFGAQYGNLGDWQAARRHFAEKAGVHLSAAEPPDSRRKKANGGGKTKGKGGGKPKADSPEEVLEFIDWTAGNENLVRLWCLKRKPGASLEAIKENGGRLAYWRCYRNKEGVRQRGKYRVIALPCYGEKLLAAPPVAWQFWNLDGDELERWVGNGKPKARSKMLSAGPTAGTLMGLVAVERLVAARAAMDAAAAGGESGGEGAGAPVIQVVWKVAGPSDLIALYTAIPPERRATDLVITNASGEQGDVWDFVPKLLAGHRTIVVHDADVAGYEGAMKWLAALAPVTECGRVLLPFERQEKAGRDLRDWILGV